jgi:predicted ribosomally synthesized peptide with SipW-like signal peptide
VDSAEQSAKVAALREEVNSLKTNVYLQASMLDRQAKQIESLHPDSERLYSPWFAAGGLILAALIGGAFASWNQNRQAKQGRLLRAVELIMESRNGFQASIRAKNLAVFLDDETKQHLETIKEEFAGPEFTDLHVGLAQAMSDKATTPEEVLRIWQAVLVSKKSLDAVKYPRIERGDVANV